MTLETMFQSHPASDRAAERARLVALLSECGQTCMSCADACLSEDGIERLRQCIRLDLDCADICAATASALARQTGPKTDAVHKLLEACAAICRTCAEECRTHAEMHEHCRICAETCEACEEACRAFNE